MRIWLTTKGIVVKAARPILLSALLATAVFITLKVSLRHPEVYFRTPVAIRFAYHLADHKIAVHGQHILHWWSSAGKTSSSGVPDPYVLLHGEHRPILERPTLRLRVPPEAQLAMGIATRDPFPGGSGSTARITLREGSAEEPIYEASLPEPGAWKEVRVDLSSFADREVELRFSVEPAVEGVALTAPYVSTSARDDRPNVIMIVLDTLRASRLGCYGYELRPASPAIDRLASNGSQFLNASSNSAGTFSSHMALLTGLYPSVSHISYRNWQSRSRARDAWAAPTLAPALTTLPQVLADHGYYTLAFTSGYLMMEKVGFHRGFQRMINTPPHSLAELTRQAEHWLGEERIEPFFLYLHSFEPHSPYEDQRFVQEEGLRSHEAVQEASYVGDIRSSDDALGRFLSWLAEQGLRDRTLLILTSDHGEEFGDHFPVYSGGHGQSLYDEAVRVPLIFSHPSIPSKQFVKQVQLVDIRPTLTDWLGIEDDFPTSGSSFVEQLRTGREDHIRERLAFAEDTSYGPEWKMLRNSRYKYIYLPTPWDHNGVGWGGWKAYRSFAYTDRHQLFDLVRDPGERTNLFASRPELADYFSREMERALAANRQAAELFGHGLEESKLSEEARRSLRSLGYLD